MYLFKYLAALSGIAAVAAVVLIVTMKRVPADRSISALLLRWLPRLLGMAAVFVGVRTFKPEVMEMNQVLAMMPFIVATSLAASIVAFSGGLIVDAGVAVVVAVVMGIVGLIGADMARDKVAFAVEVLALGDRAMLLEVGQREISRDLFLTLGSAALALLFGVIAVVVAVARRRARG